MARQALGAVACGGGYHSELPNNPDLSQTLWALLEKVNADTGKTECHGRKMLLFCLEPSYTLATIWVGPQRPDTVEDSTDRPYCNHDR